MAGPESRGAASERRDVREAGRTARGAPLARWKGVGPIDPSKAPAIGRLVRIKRRFEDYLAQINNRTKEIDAATDSLAQDTALLLEAMDRTIKSMAQFDGLREQMAASLDELLPGLVTALDTYDHKATERIETVLHRLDASPTRTDISELLMAFEAHDRRSTDGIDTLRSRLENASTELNGVLDAYDRRSADRLDALRERLESNPATKALLDLVDRAPDGLRWRLSPAPAFQGSAGLDDMELYLCAYVAGLVSNPHAMDIGAHRGRYTQALADQGMTVLAVEPNPTLAQELRTRFGGNERVSVRDAAAGANRTTAPLFLAQDVTAQGIYTDSTLYSTLTERSHIEGLRFQAGPNVEVLTVDELRRSVDWEPEFGLIKIDVEGLELAVLDGFGETRPQAVMFEFWGPQHPLVGSSAPTAPGVIIDRILDLGYRHWLSVIHDDRTVGFALNNRDVPPRSWGNYLCFKQHEPFIGAVRWCGTSMPEMIRTVDSS